MTVRPPIDRKPSYNPSDWYWSVNNSSTQVYHSRIGNFVPTSDATHQAWLAQGNRVTNIGSETDLGGVIAQSNAPRPVAANVLVGYQTAKASAIDLVQFRILFNYENRIRVLEGRAQITAQQFLAFIASQL